MQRELKPLEHFLSGGIGGICNVLTGYPFDTVKVRLQTSNHYKSTWDCISQTFKREGFPGFVKGITVPLFGYSPCCATCFLGYGLGRTFFQCEREDYHKLRTLGAGAVAGVVNTVVVSPVERVKVLLQVQSEAAKKKYSGPIDAVRKLYKEGGLRSFFRGYTATVVREIPGNSLYFLTYAHLKEHLMPPDQPTNPLVALLAGGTAGVAHWSIALPGDTLKSRIQTSPPGAYPGGLKQVFRELVRTEGVTALYRGFVPAILRAFPAHGACFVGYELAATGFTKFRQQQVN